jgi:hypothetical protein
MRACFCNPALISVLLLWFLLSFIVWVLFELVRTAVLHALVPELQSASAQQALQLLTPGVKAFLLASYALQMLVMILVLGYFIAGLFGMLKNLWHDGSTVFGEFPSAGTRYGRPVLAIQLLRGVAYAIAGLLIGYALDMLIGTTPGLLTSQQQSAVAISVAAGLLVVIVVSFVLLFAESVVARRDATAREAILESLALIRQRPVRSIGIFAVSILLYVPGIVLYALLRWGIMSIVQMMAGSWATPVLVGVDFVLSALLLTGLIFSSAFVFASYMRLVPRTRS